MGFIYWISQNYIEVFGAVAGIVYVFLEIKQNPLLWPVGIVTSGVYIYVFFTGKLYADMGLQTYYVVISFLGWYWWVRKKEKSNSYCEFLFSSSFGYICRGFLHAVITT